MVIVLMGPVGTGTATAGWALAGVLGWACVDASDYASSTSLGMPADGPARNEADRGVWLERLHALVARALDRREPLILACLELTNADRQRLAGGLRPVRFVCLDRASHTPSDDDRTLYVDGALDVMAFIGFVRTEFGL